MCTRSSKNMHSGGTHDVRIKQSRHRLKSGYLLRAKRLQQMETLGLQHGVRPGLAQRQSVASALVAIHLVKRTCL